MNQEEALRALEIARNKQSEGNIPAAIRFCRKALVLAPTLSEATVLLARLEKLDSSSSASSSGANPSAAGSSSSTATPRASTSRTSSAPEPEKKREFTPAQASLVKKVTACRVTEYYAILGLEKGCADADIKKAYRKMALGLHPDKCGAPGAEEAFKMVSKAFQVLSDSNKRAVFDQTGGDPDSRGGGGGGGGGGMASPFARGGGGGGEELSPEDLFQFFFGGGGGGGASFGGMNGFGGSGFRTQFYGPGGINFQTGGPRRAPGGQQQRQQGAQGSVWLQLAPLVILFGFSLLTQLPSLFTTPPPPDPDFAWEQTPRYNLHRQTSSIGVDYFVNAQQFSHHPIYESIVASNPSLGFSSAHEPGTAGFKSDLFQHIQKPLTVPVGEGGEAPKPPKLVVPTKLSKFERKVETAYLNELQRVCHYQMQRRQEQLERYRGFLGIGADWDKVREITNQKLDHCEKLASLGYTVN